ARRFAAPMCDPLAEVLGQRVAGQEPLEQKTRMHGSGDRVRAKRAERRLDLAAPGLRVDTQHFCVAEYLDAASLRRLLDRGGDCAHSADRMAPRAFDAVHLAERVMEQQIARPRVIRAREVSDDRIEPQAALQQAELEVPVQPVAGAAGKEIPQRSDAVPAERAE